MSVPFNLTIFNFSLLSFSVCPCAFPFLGPWKIRRHLSVFTPVSWASRRPFRCITDYRTLSITGSCHSCQVDSVECKAIFTTVPQGSFAERLALKQSHSRCKAANEQGAALCPISNNWLLCYALAQLCLICNARGSVQKNNIFHFCLQN